MLQYKYLLINELWRTVGGFGGFRPPLPEIPKFWQSRTGLQIERIMFSVPTPTS
jgi:hypothetical protein